MLVLSRFQMVPVIRLPVEAQLAQQAVMLIFDVFMPPGQMLGETALKNQLVINGNISRFSNNLFFPSFLPRSERPDDSSDNEKREF